MSAQETFGLSDIPQPLIRDIHSRILYYTVGFVRVERSDQGPDANLVGSGVLVKAGEVRAILTADHVLKVLPSSGRLGLVLSDVKENTTIEVSGTNYLRIDRGKEPEEGPDLGAVVLSPYLGSSLEARKSFYNLDHWKDRALNNPPEEREGVWVAQGFVEEKTILDPASTPYERIKGFCHFGALGGVHEYEVRKDHDYYSFPLDAPLSDDTPTSFGGCSGGGLWQVVLTKNHLGSFVPHQFLLRGLVYFQKARRDGRSALRCHGPRSVYDIAYTALERQSH